VSVCRLYLDSDGNKGDWAVQTVGASVRIPAGLQSSVTLGAAQLWVAFRETDSKGALMPGWSALLVAGVS